MKKYKIFKALLFTFTLMLFSCEGIYDDFFQTKCEKENTCEITVINQGDLPMYVDVTYTDSIPNQKRLIYPGEQFTYKMTFGNLVAWAKLDCQCGWTAQGIYIAECEKYEMKWQTVYQNESAKAVGNVAWSIITGKPNYGIQH
jgi:hypothetical protein